MGYDEAVRAWQRAEDQLHQLEADIYTRSLPCGQRVSDTELHRLGQCRLNASLRLEQARAVGGTRAMNLGRG